MKSAGFITSIIGLINCGPEKARTGFQNPSPLGEGYGPCPLSVSFSGRAENPGRVVSPDCEPNGAKVDSSCQGMGGTTSTRRAA